MRLASFLLLVLTLAGCAAAAVPWQNPQVPKDQWRSDWLGCKRWADSQVGYQEEEGSVFSDYDRARARKQMDALASGCMRDRGYVPAPKK